MADTSTNMVRLESFPFDSRATTYDPRGYPVYDRAVGASMLREVFAKFFTNGVFPNPGSALQIGKASTGLAVTIQPGIGIINGSMGGVRGDDSVTVTLDTAAPQGNVAYSIMLRYDDTDGFADSRSLLINVVRSDPDDDPVPPEPDTTSPNVYELRLGYVEVPSGATDLSAATVHNEKGLEVCPFAAPFEEIDVSGIVSDFRAVADEGLAALLEYYEANRDAVDAALDGSAATYLQQQITALQESLENFDLGGSVDDETVEYTASGGVEAKLRVKSGGIEQEHLSQWLQIAIGIADTSSYTYDDFLELAVDARGDQVMQDSLMSLLDSDTVGSWSDPQIVQFAGYLTEDSQVDFVGTLTDGRVQSMEVDYIVSLHQELIGSAKSALSSKVQMMNYGWGTIHALHQELGDEWASSFVGQTKSAVLTSGSSSGTYNFRLVGVGHDVATDGEGSTLTFQSTSSVGFAGYYGLEVRSIAAASFRGYPDTQFPDLFEDIKGFMPTDLSSAIRTVSKPCFYGRLSSDYNSTTQNLDVWPLSSYEYRGPDNPCSTIDLSVPSDMDGHQYEYYMGYDIYPNNNKIPRNGTSSYYGLLMRSGGVYDDDRGYYNMYYIGTSSSSCAWLQARASHDLVPAFCI